MTVFFVISLDGVGVIVSSPKSISSSMDLSMIELSSSMQHGLGGGDVVVGVVRMERGGLCGRGERGGA